MRQPDSSQTAVSFQHRNQILISEHASLTNTGRLTWQIRPRGGQMLQVEDVKFAEELEGKAGVEVKTAGHCEFKPFSYVRGEFFLTPDECKGRLRFELQVRLRNAPGTVVVVTIYDDPGFNDRLFNVEQRVTATCQVEYPSVEVDLGTLPRRSQPVYGFIQVCLPTSPAATVWIGRTRVVALEGPRIRFDALGDETKASSRLRVWKFVELLRHEGQDVRVGGTKTDVDIYFCQKVRPFKTVAAIRQANPGAIVVYDFDDNFTLEENGVLQDLLAFINLVDAVTCGSEYLAQTVRKWHSHVFVLENPLDVENETLCRRPSGQLRRVGWFGAPEGLAELAKTDLRDVITLTKGGDIEFDLDTVDCELTKFDLLVFPVEETPWNLAKNANRMMKALALGIPVLASATPEQRRIADLANLPRECLVPSLDGWSEALDRLRISYPEVEQATLIARETLWQSHSTTKILGGLLEYLQEIANRPNTSTRSKSSAMQRIAVALVDGSPECRALATLDQSKVQWDAFHSVHLFCARKLTNELSQHPETNIRITDGDYLAIYDGADRLLDECDADYLLVIPPGAALAFGFAAELERAISEAPLTLFGRSEYCSAAQIGGNKGAPLLKELFLRPSLLGPLLVNTQWARQNAKCWQFTYELWQWATVVRALATGTPVALVDLPFAFDALPQKDFSVPHQYAAWLREKKPEAAANLSNPSLQWTRMLTDIIADSAMDISSDLPSIVGQLYGRYMATSQRLAALEKELRELKSRKNKESL